MYNILICDDEQDIVNALKIYLSGGDYCLFEASNGREALEVVEKNDIHLILMDIMMPQLDGIAATAKLREKSNVPIILLTAKSESSDKVLGLNIGADDYITKPFGIMEFLSRVRAALRRSAPEEKQNVYAFHEILLDNARHSVTVNGTHVDLTYKEYSLLRLLLENTNLVVTRETILQVVWGTDISVESRTVDMHIRTLRKKLGDAGRYICTVRKVGYKLADNEEGEEE